MMINYLYLGFVCLIAYSSSQANGCQNETAQNFTLQNVTNHNMTNHSMKTRNETIHVEHGQRVPDLPEMDPLASGPYLGAVPLSDPSIVANYNPDVEFKDGQGTHNMTQRCSSMLNELASLVVEEWPDLKVCVVEAWVDGDHGNYSLHYEGRALDLTTSDMDENKYGTLGGLAVEAGFDWVLHTYESSHIHASCRTDVDVGKVDCASDQYTCSNGKCIPRASKCNGVPDCLPDGKDESIKAGCISNPTIPLCFPLNAQVLIKGSGKKKIQDLKIGEEVQAVSNGKITFSPVIAFMHKNEEAKSSYLVIETADGNSIAVSSKHLIYKNDSDKPVFASEIIPGDHLLEVFSSGLMNNTLKPSKVIKVTEVTAVGIFAPLTVEGTVVVDSIVSSCYANVIDHELAHMAFAPLRYVYSTVPSLLQHKSGSDFHWYVDFLLTVGSYLLDEAQVDHELAQFLGL